MLRLHIVRHGQTDWNAIRKVQGQQNSELNDTGRQQAASVRQLLRDIEFKAVFASPLLRTRETAEILCQERSNPIQFVDNLKEMGLGVWETHMWEDIPNTWPDEHAQFKQQPELFSLSGAETVKQVSERGKAAVEHIRSQVPSGDVLVVSHGVLIKSIILNFASQPLSVIWDDPHLDNCCRSILQLEHNGSGSWETVADVAIEDVEWAIS